MKFSPTDFRCQYLRYYQHGGYFHRWSVATLEHGALEFWYKKYNIDEFDGSGVLAGLECHYRKPPSYMQDKKPSHELCAILVAPCWHDGSSMAGHDFYEVHIEHNRMVNNEAIFIDLQSKFARYFCDYEE